MSVSRKVFSVIATAALSLSIAACSPPNQSDSTQTKDDEVLTTSQTSTSETTATESTTATATTTGAAATEVTVTVTPEELIDGGETTFEVTGLDPELGYYAAICAAEATPDGEAPACTGVQADFASQAWLSNTAPGATDPIADDGTATITLVAAATGEGLDCTTDECVGKIFGDHTEGFRDVTEVPVTFARS